MASNTANTEKKPFFSNMTNPILRKMEKAAQYDEPNVCTYGGIVGKTTYFLVITVIGVILFFFLHLLLTVNADPGSVVHFVDKKGVFDITVGVFEMIMLIVAALIDIIFPFLAIFLQKAIPVVGTVYCLAQGLVVGFITTALASDLRWISILAMILTIALVASMLFIYAKHIIKVTQKFKTVIFGAFFAIVLGGIVSLILFLIPITRGFISAITGNPVISIITSIIFVLIAAFFMLADFDTIENCVKNGLDKKYEWMAAWGLAYTILYIYFKILRILIMIFGRGRSSSSSGGSF